MRFSSARRASGEAKPPLTSMVDIVFLLLVFFVMTFNVVPAEGDFDIKYAGGGTGDGPFVPVVKVTVFPNASDPRIHDISWQVGFNDAVPVTDIQMLNDLAWGWRKQHERAGGTLTEKLVVTLDVDPRMPFQTTMDVLAAVSIREQEGEKVDLFNEVSFSSRLPAKKIR